MERMKFIITVDVEEDDPWKRQEQIETVNSRYIPRFQELCNRYQFKPTYLCSYEMVMCDMFKRFIKQVLQEEKAEVGAHLHPWRCPPIVELTGHDYKYLPYPHEYPENLIHEKLSTLTQSIRNNLAIPPRSYRAGRWGLVSSHIPILEDLGFRVDSSITPKVSWKDTPGLPGGAGGIDFSSADLHPHFLNYDENREKRSRILEVPVTILFPVRLFNSWNIQWKFFINNRNRLLKKIIGRLGLAPQWFRPYAYMGIGDLINIFKKARGINLPCVNLMFHSNELMPGGSPYHLDQKAVDALYEKFEKLFQFLYEENVHSVTLSEFAYTFRGC